MTDENIVHLAPGISPSVHIEERLGESVMSVHGSDVVTPCCGKTIFELPRTDRLALHPRYVTCGQLPAEKALRTLREELAKLEWAPEITSNQHTVEQTLHNHLEIIERVLATYKKGQR